MLLTKKNFSFQKKYAYSGDDKYPRFILRGKKISKELAEKIIVTEMEMRFLEDNPKIPSYEFSYNQESVKKPLSIQEAKDAEEREKCINGIDDTNDVTSDIDSDDTADWLNEYHQEFVPNTPITDFVDVFGNVGVDGNTFKWPMSYEFIVEHLEYANRYPFLSYIIIYSDYDVKLYENKWLDDLYPPMLNNINQDFEAFIYALHVHDGGVEVVNKEEAIKLYKKYQKQYPNDLIFNKRDYNKYVKDTFSSYDIPLILKNWEIEPKIKKEIKKAYKSVDKRNKVSKWIREEKRLHYTDEQYLEYVNMSKELNNIYYGKKTKLDIDENVYNMLKKYLKMTFKYHERMNKVKDIEKSLQKVLLRDDYSLISDVIYRFRYSKYSIDFEYENDKKNNNLISIDKRLYKYRIDMYDELEHIRKGEKTKLNYNKGILKKLKRYLNYIVDEDGNEIEKKELNQIWSMERDLQLKIDKKTYNLITDTVLYTKSSMYNLEKEYKIYCKGREIAISFMRDIEKAVKKKDYELKDINVKEYIGKYNKLYKDHKTILKMGLMYM